MPASIVDTSWRMYYPYNGDFDYAEGIFARFYTDFKETPLQLNITQKEWKLTPSMNTEVVMKSTSKESMNLLIECRSYLFEIKNATHQKGIFSQFGVVLKEGEKAKFSIGLKTSSDNDGAEFINTPEGHITISHVEEKHSTMLNDCSSASKDGLPKKILPRLHKRDEAEYGFHKSPLEITEETKKVMKKRENFAKLKTKLEKRKAEGKSLEQKRTCIVM